MTGSIGSRTDVLVVGAVHVPNHAFCRMLSAMRIALARRKRRREAEAAICL